MTSTTVPMAIVAAFAFLALGAVAAVQVSPDVAPALGPPQPMMPSLQLKPPLTPVYEGSGAPQRAATIATTAPTKVNAEPAATPNGVRRITLEEAQQQAGSASNNPLVRLGQLQVEVARQNRMGAFSSFFPQIGSSFENMHFNKFMGQQVQVANRTLGLPLLGQNQTFISVTATQPITPLFQI